tara:strand:- start:57 stop:395 length:339 start_codon:yes stop_codon:yes gene_type:complete
MKKIIKLITTLSFLFGIGLTFPVFANVFDPDIEIKIKGLVCPSCAIGIKNGLQKTKLVKQIKFNTKKQLCIVEYISIEIHPSQIAKIVKDAGYEVTSIRWLNDKKPNRYNKP